jgi:hypothetical protein
MNRIVSRQKENEPKIRLVKDETYFRWRFSNPKKKYLFYFNQVHDTIAGYIVLGMASDLSFSTILDYEEGAEGTLKVLLEFIVENKQWDRLLIPSFGLNGTLSKTLSGLGIHQTKLQKEMKNRAEGSVPLLVRPVKAHPDEKDWLLNGLDTRNFNHWEITPLSCDGE